MKTDEIRSKYLKFFEERGAKLCSSDSLVPANDPTLLFTGAGMNQFKDYFLGIGKMDFRKATSCQKCIRTGDIMNVGVTPCHHTFFEMLGNFSFGDYFKKEAIAWAWEFLTNVMKIDENRLQVSVHTSDNEAAEIWKKSVGLTDAKINVLGDHDNFWPADAPKMGPNGPCGPCSEIFYDRGPEYGEDQGITGENRRWVEIWNLVFTQFDRRGVDDLVALPQCNIDTGMGLERMASCMQNTATNMDIDIFQPLVNKVAEIGETSYGKNKDHDILMRRIADHARAVTFCIGDGVMPGNTHRGYVLKRLLRRAATDGRALGITKSFIKDLVPIVAQVMGNQYPEIKQQQENISSTILHEEEKFLATLDKGLTMIDMAIRKAKDENASVFSGESAFELYDTYGFPYELTEELVRQEKFEIDREGYEEAMTAAKEKARAGAKMKGDVFAKGPITEIKKVTGETEFLGYENTDAQSCKVIGIIKGDALVESANAGDEVTIVLDKTPFYGESGGQVGDIGTITGLDNLEIAIDDTEKIDGIFLHIGKIESGTINKDQEVACTVEKDRRMDICRNHSATHLLHKALRDILGENAVQKGSYVSPERFRFDFQHQQALTQDQQRRVGEAVNYMILEANNVKTEVKSIDEAKSEGAMALFGEKYGDTVRMVKIGDISTELCGGTHVDNTAKIGSFFITNQEAVSAGIRRIEGVTGHYAARYVRKIGKIIVDVVRELNTSVDELPNKITAMLDNEKALRKELAALKSDQVKKQLEDIQTKEIGGIQYAAINAGAVTGKELTAAADVVRNKVGDNGVAVLAGTDGDKVSLVVTVGKALAPKTLKAGDIVKKLAPMVGGGGGGRPDMAQAGGKEPENLPKMLDSVEAVLSEMLG